MRLCFRFALAENVHCDATWFRRSPIFFAVASMFAVSMSFSLKVMRKTSMV